MTGFTRETAETPTPPPAGMIEYETRTAIRDLIRIHGFDEARALVAMMLNDEAERARTRIAA